MCLISYRRAEEAGCTMQPTTPNPSKPTFAEKLANKIQPLTNFEHPTEEQGLIFNHLEGTKIREYLVAIYQLVGGAANIIAASRVSGGRVIIFLAKKELVDSFQQNYGGFQLCNTFIKTRKLKAPAVKLIISNVSPLIPNTAIEKALQENLNLKLVSPVSLLRVSPRDDLFPHVVCWRRQVYVNSADDNFTFPSSFTLNYADRSYRIFLNSDSLTCFKCSSKGHKAEDCTRMVDEEFEDSFANITNVQQPERPQENDLLSEYPPLIQIQEKTSPTPAAGKTQTQPPKVPQQAKRGSSTLASSSSTDTEIAPTATQKSSIPQQIKLVQMKTDQNANQTKRFKTSETTRPPLILSTDEIAKINMKFDSIQLTKPIDCQITAKEFIEFLPAIRSSTNKLEIAKNLTPRPPEPTFHFR